MGAIIKRELSAYFSHPIGYIFIGISLLIASVNFVMYVFWNGYTDMRAVIQPLYSTMYLLVPLLTMRLLSEEKRHKTEQLLYTSPVTMTQVVLGKFIGAWVIYLASTAIVLLYQVVLQFYATVDWGTLISGYIGLALFGALMIGLGMLISSLTESQTVAAISGIAASIVLNASVNWCDSSSAFISKMANWFCPQVHFSGFFKGIIAFEDIFFFVFTTGALLFIAVRVMDKKRYV